MRRPQFRYSTLLWLMLAVACWFGGREYHRRAIDRQTRPLIYDIPLLIEIVEEDEELLGVEGAVKPSAKAAPE
jgi:hypothetical protein